jgi:hypothetical protein
VIKVFLDNDRTNFSGYPHYSSLGNKILHLFFCIKLADKYKLELKIPFNSNLDKVFDTTNLIEQNNNVETVFIEQNEYSSKDIEKIFINSQKQLSDALLFLNITSEKIINFNSHVKKNISVKGHYHHYDLMPDLETINKYIPFNKENLKVAQEILQNIYNKYEHPIFVHYRGKDFANHECGLGDCRLKQQYYLDSFEACLRANDKTTFICLSDEPSFYTNFKNKYNIVISDNQKYEIDWLLMHLCQSLISSNSTFAWTASLHNKNFLIQPKCGMNLNKVNDLVVPYGFYIKDSKII